MTHLSCVVPSLISSWKIPWWLEMASPMNAPALKVPRVKAVKGDEM